LGFRSLTRLYDPIVAETIRKATFKSALIEQAGIAPGHKVLDHAWGTGTWP
jgi:ubiquinone/menaquinone biosynthesis C-methylase UbiE